MCLDVTCELIWSLSGSWQNYSNHFSYRVPHRGQEATRSLPSRRPVVHNDQLVWGICQVGTDGKNDFLQGQPHATPGSSDGAQG